MLQVWLGERMGEEHRRDLLVSPQPRKTDGAGGQPAAVYSRVTGVANLRVVPPRIAPGSRTARRRIGHQVGALLIRAGTRLGGASMRTS
jgi:hypothetical protein